jgi:hypothetical protein
MMRNLKSKDFKQKTIMKFLKIVTDQDTFSGGVRLYLKQSSLYFTHQHLVCELHPWDFTSVRAWLLIIPLKYQVYFFHTHALLAWPHGLDQKVKFQPCGLSFPPWLARLA